MNTIIRMFRQTFPQSDDTNRELSPLVKFLKHKVIVVLGAPGLGKTTIFKQYSESEKNASYVRVGEFLAAVNIDSYKDKILYLDGLDEQRSKSNGKGVMDALVSQLRRLNPPKVRLSCRTAEWHGNQDVKAVGELFSECDVYQLMLMPLSENQLTELLSEETSSEFISGAKERKLEELLTNPGDFILLNQFYKENHDWPRTRSELMEGACRALLKEVNIDHCETLTDKVNDVALFKSSEYLSAIMMLSGIDGLATSRLNVSKKFPAIHQLDDDLFSMKVAASHSLFTPIENGRVEPRHRKIAEYMTARYLARRVKEGLSLRRLMTLLTGFDGKTAPDLRGVYAWMVTLLAGSAEKILHHDPYGAIIYGDAYSWTPNTKKTALKLLKELSLKDPWFRQQDYSVKELGGLVDVSFADYLIELIQTDTCNSHLLSVVFDAISASDSISLSMLEIYLVEFIEDTHKPDRLRNGAIKALKTASKNPTPVLLKMLDKVNDGLITDPKQELRGTLLKYLYPSEIVPSQIMKYLVKPVSGYIGRYYMYMEASQQ